MQGPVSDNILGLYREDAAAPDSGQIAGARLITKVAEHCLAAQAGIKRGDLILSINAKPPADVDETSRSILCDSVIYRIWDARHKQLVHLRTNATPLGVDTRRTEAAIRRHLSTDSQTFADPYDFLDIWEARDWDLLAHMATAYLQQSRRLRSHGSWMRRLWLGLSYDAWDAPALLFRGASLCEKGQMRAGMSLIRKYAEHFAGHWTLDMRGVAQYYIARDLQEKDRADEAIDVLQQAYNAYPLRALSQALARLTGRAPGSVHHWAGLRFPVMYQFPLLAEVGPYGMLEASLPETLSTMTDKQVLAVCCLAGYRGNGPYNEFMRRFIAYQGHFSDVLCGLHVITSSIDRPATRPDWFRAEDAARERQLPYCVLHDRRDELTGALGLRRSPTIFLLNAHGTVLYEGWLNSDVDWWEALSRTSKQDMPTGSVLSESDLTAMANTPFGDDTPRYRQ